MKSYIYLAVKTNTLNNSDSAIIFKIGETNDISKRRYAIAKNDGDTIVKYVAIKNQSERFRRLVERIAQNAVIAKFGNSTKSIGNDHFVTISTEHYNRVFNGFEKIVEFAEHRANLIISNAKKLDI